MSIFVFLRCIELARPIGGEMLDKIIKPRSSSFTNLHRRSITSHTVNIDTSVNAASTADKLNAAKSYFDITHC